MIQSFPSLGGMPFPVWYHTTSYTQTQWREHTGCQLTLSQGMMWI